jgi:hypothetical protein
MMILEHGGSSLEVNPPASGTAFGDEDTFITFTSPSARMGSDNGLESIDRARFVPETANLRDLLLWGGTEINSPGDIIENFDNSWETSSQGLVYNDDVGFVRYVHESAPNPTIYNVDTPAPHTVLGSTSLSTLNPGWPASLDHRNGVGYEDTLGTYLMPDYNGDLVNANDNLVEVAADGTILHAWETDGEDNDSYDASAIPNILDMAVYPGPPARYFATAFGDGSTMYEVDLIRSGVFVSNTWGTVSTCTVPGLSENSGIDYDKIHGVLFHSDFNSDQIVVTDFDCNLVAAFRCPSPSSRNTGVTFIEGSSPPEVWVTDYLSNSTTRCEAVGEPVTVQALAEVGEGDVFAVGDANLWDNYDHDGNEVASLYESDNELLAHNVFGFGEDCYLCPIALFKDTVNPWTPDAGANLQSQGNAPEGITPDPNEEIMGVWGIPYDVYDSTDMGVADLAPYCKVMVASGQPYSFYEALASSRAWFEDWIEEGGMFELHGAAFTQGDDWEGLVMPGGFSHVWNLYNDVAIEGDSHDLLNKRINITDAELDGWTYSTHGYFDSLPPRANVIISHGLNNFPVATEFLKGKGCVVATDQPLEYAWDQGFSYILENFVLYNRCSGFSITFLPSVFSSSP